MYPREYNKLRLFTSKKEKENDNNIFSIKLVHNLPKAI